MRYVRYRIIVIRCVVLAVDEPSLYCGHFVEFFWRNYFLVESTDREPWEIQQVLSCTYLSDQLNINF